MDLKPGIWVTLKHNIYDPLNRKQPIVYSGTSGQIVSIEPNKIMVNFYYDRRNVAGNHVYAVYSCDIYTDDHYMHDLKIDDRVVAEVHGMPHLATVIAGRRNNGLDIGIQCDEDVGGHICSNGEWNSRIDGSHTGLSGHCWWADVHYVFKITSKEQEENYVAYYYKKLKELNRESYEIPF